MGEDFSLTGSGFQGAFPVWVSASLVTDLCISWGLRLIVLQPAEMFAGQPATAVQFRTLLANRTFLASFEWRPVSNVAFCPATWVCHVW